MTLPTLVRADTNDAVTVTARAQIKHLCPFKDEVDTGTATITWTCAGWTIELHSLAEYLASFANQAISHECLAASITADLQALGDLIAVQSVTARFTTAGIDVEVRRGPVHVDAVGA